MISKKLYIHIGTHKTGTTAIQKVLKENVKSLKKENITYIPLVDQTKKLKYVNKVERELVSSNKKFLLSFFKKNKKSKCFIWSFEGFSGDPLKGYNNSEVIAESLRKITQGINVKIIVYLRKQDQFIESLYTQMIHQGESYNFEYFIKRFKNDDFNWYLFLNNYSKYFGKENIIVKQYDKEILKKRKGIINDFIGIIGVQNLKIKKNKMIANKGYSRNALEIAKILNPKLNDDEKKVLRKFLKTQFSKKPFENYTYWNENHKKLLMNNISNSNSKVAKEYINNPSGILFPTEEQMLSGKQEFNGLTIESVVDIFGKEFIVQKNIINKSISNRFLRRIKLIKKKFY